MTAASPARCLPGKRLGLAGAERKGRLKHNRSNRKQVENLFSIYVSTHRGRGEALWCVQLLLAACPVLRARKLPRGCSRAWALVLWQVWVPQARSALFLPKVATLFSGPKPAFPQFAHEAVSGARLLAVSQVFVYLFFKLI